MDDSLRALVWQRAEGRCEYCRFPAKYAELDFEIDHVIARKHRGGTTEENLALACFFCNSYKGPNIASIDEESGILTPLFNPRSDEWLQHFSWEGPAIRGLTAVGRVTVHVLQLNHPDAMAVREAMMQEGIYLPSPRS